MFSKKSYKVKQTFECNEKWHQMDKIDGGRFCDRCDKKIIDLTTTSDFRLYKLLKEAEGKVCGRITEKQLNREIHFTSPFKIKWNKKYFTIPAMITALTGFIKSKTTFASTLIESEPVKIEQQDHRAVDTVDNKIKISGTVYDEETDEGLAFANIVLSRNGRLIDGTTSDINGKFSLIISEKYMGEVEIELSYVGYENMTRSLLVTESVGGLEFVMAPDQVYGILGAIMIVEEPRKKRRSNNKNRTCDAPVKVGNSD